MRPIGLQLPAATFTYRCASRARSFPCRRGVLGSASHARMLPTAPFPRSPHIVLRKPNYSYEKRQKDLAKQKKNEEKRLRRLERSGPSPDDTPAAPPPSGSDTDPSQS